MNFEIISFDNNKHRDQVVSLWKDVFGYETSHNSPGIVIDKKVEFNDDLFFIAVDSDNVIGTVMAGYDGHRGWIYFRQPEPGGLGELEFCIPLSNEQNVLDFFRN